jgi:hypothetical protein
MSNGYIVTMQNATVIADGELVTIRAATAFTSRGSLLEILRMHISQRGTTTSQQLGCRWGLKASAFGTFTAATPSPIILNAVASALAGSTSNAAASAGVNASANGAGTLTVLDGRGFNNLAGFEWIATDKERVIVGPDLTFLLQLQGTPTTLTGWNASVTLGELT